jgi:hypothetical protein
VLFWNRSLFCKLQWHTNPRLAAQLSAASKEGTRASGEISPRARGDNDHDRVLTAGGVTSIVFVGALSTMTELCMRLTDTLTWHAYEQYCQVGYTTSSTLESSLSLDALSLVCPPIRTDIRFPPPLRHRFFASHFFKARQWIFSSIVWVQA